MNWDGESKEWNDENRGALTGDKGEKPLLAERYRVVRQLGQGGMGSVWLAEDTKLDGRQVAIKMLPSVLMTDKRAYKQVKQEALVSLKLSHTNIATVRAFEEAGGCPFLVMDYIEGRTLNDLLGEKDRLSEEETVQLLGPVADALDYAHKAGVVHRDVKPGNVIIAKDGTPFVLDFGIACEVRETVMKVTGANSSGTLPYMSPEQLHGASPKPPQDVYSFAATVYECLTGCPPFSRGQIEYQIDHDTPEPLSSSIGIADSILAGLAKSPEDRPATCRAVLKARRAERVRPAAPPPQAEKTAGKSAVNGVGKGFLIAVGLLGAAVIGYFVNSGSSTNPLRRDVSVTQETYPSTVSNGGSPTERATSLYRVIDLADGTETYLDAEPSGGWSYEYKTRKLVLRRIKPGTFTMGSPQSEEGRSDDEKQHTVVLTKPYYMGVFEVTQGQWERVMGNNPSCFKGASRPVEKVSWDDCQAFCRKAGRGLRLPTEAEWEYACRAGTTTALPNGEALRILGANNGPALDGIAWYGGNSGVDFELSNGSDSSGWEQKQYNHSCAGTHPVGKKRANAWGLYDMIGNVWEWCADWYDSGYYAKSPLYDPPGPASGGLRVYRGGGWRNFAWYCRSASRLRFSPDYRFINLGFRLCCSAGPSE